MRRLAAGLLSLVTALGPMPAGAGYRPGPPPVSSPEEEEDPDFRRPASGRDLHALVLHVASCIGGEAGAVQSVDAFIANLERQLRKGNDLPRDRILRNADAAREALRLAYNELAEAERALPPIRDAFHEVNERLAPVLKANGDNVEKLGEAAEGARALVAAMVVARPASPGRPVSTAILNSIAPLEPEIRALRAPLRKAEQDLERVKAVVGRAKAASLSVQGLAQKAADLDQDALDRLGQRRARGTTVQYQTSMSSREVLAHANQWLQAAVARAEQAVRIMEKQGALKALDRSSEADAATQAGKSRQERAAERINFNHDVRLNDLIQYGYDVASDERRGWWVERARMARASSAEDSAKMEEAARQAQESGSVAEGALQVSVRNVERIDAILGQRGRPSSPISKRMTDVPAVKESPSRAGPSSGQFKSKPIKIPHTLNVSEMELIRSMDGRGRR